MGGRWYDEAYDPKGMQRVGSVAYGGSKEGLNTMGMENLRRYQCKSRWDTTCMSSWRVLTSFASTAILCMHLGSELTDSKRRADA